MEIGGNSDITTLALQTIIGLTGASLAFLLLTAAVRVRVRMPRPPMSGPLA
ncbi:MAG: hypothetical protein QOK47_1434, partial [Actinomycetota bacterium]|nr:hypothetical protein [Actinomycetota bacterium]